MAESNQVKKEYGSQAGTYDDYRSSPLGILESQLISSAIGSPKDLTVLDLGGGTGNVARKVLEDGAKSVDVIDISPEMLHVGQEAEKSIESGRIRWIEADVSKPLDHLELPKYDLVMANWVFDHATSIEMLEGMWANIAAYIKPGGRFVGVRMANPKGPVILSGIYGVKMKDHVEIPGGLKYRFELPSNPPVDFEASSMEISYSGSTEMHKKYGFDDVEIEPYEDAEIVVKGDPEFWRAFLDYPSFAVVKARKTSEI